MHRNLTMIDSEKDYVYLLAKTLNFFSREKNCEVVNGRLKINRLKKEDVQILNSAVGILHKDTNHAFNYINEFDVGKKYTTATIEISPREKYNGEKKLIDYVTDFRFAWGERKKAYYRVLEFSTYKFNLINCITEIKKQLPNCSKKDDLISIEEKIMNSTTLNELKVHREATLNCAKVHRNTGCFASFFRLFKTNSESIFHKFFPVSGDIKLKK